MAAEPLVSQFTGEVGAVVERYRDQGLTVAEVLGALDLVHAGVMKDALDSAEEEGPA